MYKILVVDDNSVSAMVAGNSIRNTAQRIGLLISIDYAESGRSAIRTCQYKNYDLIFMDYLMPEIDGAETAQAIRNLGGYYKEIPIGIVTSNLNIKDANKCLTNGCTFFCSRPVDDDNIRIAFSQMLYMPPIEEEVKKKNNDIKRIHRTLPQSERKSC